MLHVQAIGNQMLSLRGLAERIRNGRRADSLSTNMQDVLIQGLAPDYYVDTGLVLVTGQSENDPVVIRGVPSNLYTW